MDTPLLMVKLRKRRDLPTTLYRVLLYLSRKQNAESDTRRMMRIERAVGVERKELKTHLDSLVEKEYVEAIERGTRGRGGHPVVHYNISETGRVLRQDIGRFIQHCIDMGYYPEQFFYLPSD